MRTNGRTRVSSDLVCESAAAAIWDAASPREETRNVARDRERDRTEEVGRVGDPSSSIGPRGKFPPRWFLAAGEDRRRGAGASEGGRGERSGMSGSKRGTVLARISELDENAGKRLAGEATAMLGSSPISGIVRGLMNSSLSPSGSATREDSDIDASRDRRGPGLTAHGDHGGLFKNAFKIKNTPESGESGAKARRLLGMGSRRFSSAEAPVPRSVDKENGASVRSPSSISPQKVAGSKRTRHPLEDCDPNSQDSGYEASYPEKEEKLGARHPADAFRFAEPLAVAPRRMSSESRGSVESPVRSSPRRTRRARPSLFRSLSSGYESMDDGFNELPDTDSLEDSARLPNGISSLLRGDIVAGDALLEATVPDDRTSPKLFLGSADVPSTPEFAKTGCVAENARRPASVLNEKNGCGWQENRRSSSSSSSSSSLSRVRSCLFRSPSATSSTSNPGFEEAAATSTGTTTTPVARRRRLTGELAEGTSPLSVRAFKRPDPPEIERSPKFPAKRSRKSGGGRAASLLEDAAAGAPRSLQRSLSETASGTGLRETEAREHIESAIRRSTTDTDLTGDFSKPCVLPLAAGHHEDLRTISADTLAALIRGEFNDRIGSFRIVDCRYPYEFDAGHIRGAVNLYSRDLIERILLDPLTSTPEIQPAANKRNILVFHCEFSWERGPNLSRFLRNLDRQRNKEHYPALHYPEVYLLHGGYELFYREQKALCSPQGYRPMRHPDHEADLRQFRSKSRSWQGEKSRNAACPPRPTLKRLGF